MLLYPIYFELYSLTFYVCEHVVNILGWQKILIPHFVSIVSIALILLAPNVNFSLLKRIFKIKFTFYVWI